MEKFGRLSSKKIEPEFVRLSSDDLDVDEALDIEEKALRSFYGSLGEVDKMMERIEDKMKERKAVLQNLKIDPEKDEEYQKLKGEFSKLGRKERGMINQN